MPSLAYAGYVFRSRYVDEILHGPGTACNGRVWETTEHLRTDSLAKNRSNAYNRNRPFFIATLRYLTTKHYSMAAGVKGLMDNVTAMAICVSVDLHTILFLLFYKRNLMTGAPARIQ